jgi:superfamily II DNA/RNA helicase
MNSFSDFGLLRSLLTTLKENGIHKPTEIQAQAIPLIMSGQSVVAVSETGSGKTLTYALPILHAIKTLEDSGNPVTENATPRAVIMVPTRELGEQVAKVFKVFTHGTRLRVRPALGGMAFEQARRNISSPFEILLATPGRLVQLIEKDLIQLHDVRMLVFDEADQMLDQGFLPNSDHIVDSCPKDVHLSLFSATVSKAVQELMNTLFSKAEVLRSEGSGKVTKSLVTDNRTVVDGKRWPVLEKVLRIPLKKNQGGTILFTNTREQCDKLAQELKDHGYECAIYRGEMDKNERRSNLKKFRTGEIDLLVSTDLAARGLDVDHVGRVINYHLPEQKENYLHRAGRTARAGRSGIVVNLVTERDLRLIASIEGKKVDHKKGRTDNPFRSAKVKEDFPETKAIDTKVHIKSNEYKTKSTLEANGYEKKTTKPAFDKKSDKKNFKKSAPRISAKDERYEKLKPKPKQKTKFEGQKSVKGNTKFLKNLKTGKRPSTKS